MPALHADQRRRDAEVNDGVLIPCGYGQEISLGTAKALPSIPALARVALIVVTDQAVRWRDDETDPTTTIGMPLAADFPFFYNGDLTKFKVIEVTSGAKLNVSYYR